MAALFGLLALFLFAQVRSSQNRDLDNSLRTRAGEVLSLTPRLVHPITASAHRRRATPANAFAQLVDVDGHVIDSTGGLRDRALLSREEIARALHSPIFLNRPHQARLYAVATGHGKVVVVGASVAPIQEATQDLGQALLLGLPLALALASALAYLLTGRVLGPIERISEQAALISAGDQGMRLPVPSSRDEIRRLGETLNGMLDRLDAAVERERRFVSDASHELRTPLAVLKSELEVALVQDGTREQWREAVISAVEEAEQVIALAEDLLVLARAQDGQLALSVERLDAAEVIRLAADRVRPFLAAGGRSVAVEPSPPLTIRADPVRLRQMLDNVLSNAIDHGRGTVTLSATLVGACVELHVTDEGDGFPESFLPRAFDRFARADQARGRGGSGLGLAIVESLARCHGGGVGAATGPHGGADVWISLPAARAGAVAPAEAVA
jgi:signal transduction histidine kinase